MDKIEVLESLYEAAIDTFEYTKHGKLKDDLIKKGFFYYYIHGKYSCLAVDTRCGRDLADDYTDFMGVSSDTCAFLEVEESVEQQQLCRTLAILIYRESLK